MMKILNQLQTILKVFRPRIKIINGILITRTPRHVPNVKNELLCPSITHKMCPGLCGVLIAQYLVLQVLFCVLFKCFL